MKGIDTKEINVLELFGKELQALYSIKEGAYEMTVLHYVSGIDQFDELLGNKKFCETSAILNVTSHEKGIFIILNLKGKISLFAFSREQIVSFKEMANQQILVHSENRFAKRLKSGGGSLALMAVGAIGDAIIPTSAKQVTGKIYSITLLENGEKCEVLLSRPNEEFEYDEKRSKVDAYINRHFVKTKPQGIVDFEDKSGCFIATACYGSYFAPEVAVFRRFRDHTLATTWLGLKLIKLYYSISPPLAQAIRDNKLLRWVVRHLFIKPLSIFIR